MTTDYNGWTNWATWNVYLWLSNDEPLYRAMLDVKPGTATEAEQFVRTAMPNGTPDFNGPNDYDLVNWAEIARGIVEDTTEWGCE